MLTEAHIDARLALLALAFKERTGLKARADAHRQDGIWSIYVREAGPVGPVGDTGLDADFDRACDKVAAKIAKRASLLPTADAIAKAHGLTATDLARLIAADPKVSDDFKRALAAA